MSVYSAGESHRTPGVNACLCCVCVYLLPDLLSGFKTAHTTSTVLGVCDNRLVAQDKCVLIAGRARFFLDM